jgi:hypothetical protein
MPIIAACLCVHVCPSFLSYKKLWHFNYIQYCLIITWNHLNILMLVFWVVMLCGLVGRYQHFGETYYLHLQPFRSAQHYNLEDQHQHLHYNENLRPHILNAVLNIDNCTEIATGSQCHSDFWVPHLVDLMKELVLEWDSIKFSYCELLALKCNQNLQIFKKMSTLQLDKYSVYVCMYVCVEVKVTKYSVCTYIFKFSILFRGVITVY